MKRYDIIVAGAGAAGLMAAAGAQGQFIIVLPKWDAVIVGIADIKDDDHKEMALMWKYIVPVLKQAI